MNFTPPHLRTEIEFEQFIGIFPNVIEENLCKAFVQWFDKVSEANITLTAQKEFASQIGGPDKNISQKTSNLRKDESIRIPSGLPMDAFPTGLCVPLWTEMKKCANRYFSEYQTPQPLESTGFKLHKVLPTGGYHVWHHEHHYHAPYRILAWHLTLEAPKRGGETEFLYQSMRVEPEVGKVVIWPAGFTHLHRGNPPLEGQKLYLTGWFDLADSNAPSRR